MHNVTHDIRNHLRGTLEIFLFRQNAVARFQPGLGAMLGSFFVLMLAWPFNFYFNKMAMSVAEQGGSETLEHFLLLSVLEITAVMAGLYAVCAIEKKPELFYTSVAIGNWMSISTLVPFTILAAVYWGKWQDTALFLSGIFFVAFAAYTMLCSAMVMKSLLRISWKRGILYTLAILLLVIGLQRGLSALAGF